MSSEAPRRWVEEDSDFAAAAQGFRADGPSESELARMLGQLQPQASQPRASWWKPTAVISALVMACAMWWVGHQHEPAAPLPRATPIPTPASVEPVTKPIPEPVSVEPPAAQTPPRVVKRRAKPAVVETADPLAELELLQRARRILPASPARTLALVAEHEQHYAHGQFVEERERLAVEALFAEGSKLAGRARAARFIKRFPASVHRELIDSLVAQSERSEPPPARPHP